MCTGDETEAATEMYDLSILNDPKFQHAAWVAVDANKDIISLASTCFGDKVGLRVWKATLLAMEERVRTYMEKGTDKEAAMRFVELQFIQNGWEVSLGMLVLLYVVPDSMDAKG